RARGFPVAIAAIEWGKHDDPRAGPLATTTTAAPTWPEHAEREYHDGAEGRGVQGERADAGQRQLVARRIALPEALGRRRNRARGCLRRHGFTRSRGPAGPATAHGRFLICW